MTLSIGGSQSDSIRSETGHPYLSLSRVPPAQAGDEDRTFYDRRYRRCLANAPLSASCL